MGIIDVAKVDGLRTFETKEVPDPEVEEDEVLIKVLAIVVNGSDIFAKEKYCSISPRSYVGLECSGIVEKVGMKVSVWKRGDKVCAILCGRGYAEKVAVHESHIFLIPSNVNVTKVACYPHASCVAWIELFSKTNISPFFYLPAGGKRERLLEKQSFLVHEDRDGTCDFAMRIAKEKEVNVLVTRTSECFHDHCKRLNIQNIKQTEFFQSGSPNRFDVILSNLGPEYSERHISRLHSEGMVINMNTCFSDNIDSFGWYPSLADKCLPKRVVIQAASLVNRSKEERSMIVATVQVNLWPTIHFIKPYVYKEIYPFSKVEEAHSLMKQAHTHHL